MHDKAAQTKEAIMPDKDATKSALSPLKWVAGGTPTNYNMLIFRTLNRELGLPNANSDHLAALFRDKLMPVRSWWLKRAPGAWKQFKNAVEHKKLGAPGVVNFVDARTKWFDQVVDEAITQHAIKQVVIIAAGYDTRSYRFAAKHPGVKFFEVDLPHASRKKQQLVKELLQPESSFPHPIYIAADLSTTSLANALVHATPTNGSTASTHTPAHTPAGNSNRELSSTGSFTAAVQASFDPLVPTLFTLEGLIYYLPEGAVQQLFASILSLAAPGSRVAFDLLDKQVLLAAVPPPAGYKVTAKSVAYKGEPFLSGIGSSKEAVTAFLQTATVLADGTTAAAAAVAGHATMASGPTSTVPDKAAVAAAQSESDGVCLGASGAASNGSQQQQQKKFQVVEHLGPRDMLARQLPHVTWDDKVPPILSFYSFAHATVVV